MLQYMWEKSQSYTDQSIMWFRMLYLHQEAMLQSWGGFTMPNGLGGEEQLHQLLGAELD